MLGGTPLSSVLGAGIENTDHTAVRAVIREMCRIGLSVMLVSPGTKEPIDLRTPAKRKADDKAAQKAAEAAGRADWRQVKSASGLALATSKADTLLKAKTGYLDRYIELLAPNYPDGPVPVNIAVEIGGTDLLVVAGNSRSKPPKAEVRHRMVVVDCDTPEQIERFFEVCGIPPEKQPPPTVLSPGAIGKDGDPDDPETWHHRDGGHFYFWVPDDVELPDNVGALVWPGEHKFAVLWDRRYVLVPPSTRPEGRYELSEAGREYKLPKVLADAIVTAGAHRALQAQRAAEGHHGELDEAIDAWAQTMPWHVILEPHGWTPHTRPDNCGCDVWTAPGPHDSPKSATAHDSGCSLGRYTEVNAPLHIWTDNPGEPFASWIADEGTQTVTKLRAVALLEFGGDMGKAMETLNLFPEPETLSGETEPSADNIETADGAHEANLSESLDMPPAPTVLDRMTPAQRAAAERAMAEDSEPVDPEFTAYNLPSVIFRDSHGHYYDDDTGAGIVITNDIEHDVVATAYVEQERAKVGPPPPGAVEDPWPADGDPVYLSPAALAEANANNGQNNPKIIECSCGVGIVVADTYLDADGDRYHRGLTGDNDDGSPDDHLVVEEPERDEDGYLPGEREAEHRAENPEVYAAEAHDRGAIPKDAFGTEPDGSDSKGTAAAAPDPGPEAELVDDEDADPHVLISETRGVPIIAPLNYWRSMPAPEYIIDGLMETTGMSCLIGAPGVGKSVVALDMACHIATGKRWQGRVTRQTKVLYMPGEGLSGAIQRAIAWEDAHQAEVGTNLLFSDAIIKLGSPVEVWREVVRYAVDVGVGYVIFDTFARMATGIEENSATEVGKAIERLDEFKNATGTGILIVHHTGKHSETGRGSSALNGAIDTEMLVREARWDTTQVIEQLGHLPGKPIELDTTKQKNAPQLDDPVQLFLVTHDRLANGDVVDAPVLTGASGTVDPMTGAVVTARPVPERGIETAVRVFQYAGRFPQQGFTRADAARDVRPDAHTAGRPDAVKHWRRKVNEAIDLAMRYDLLVTLSGTPSGQRYIPSPTAGVEAARRRADEDAITDQSTDD